jgi:hypothetical protein
MCPLNAEKVDLLQRARAAIVAGDRRSALRLLREMLEGNVDLSRVPVSIGDALVATAGGAEQDDALAKLRHIEQARGEVIHLLEDTPFGSADLAAIRHVLDSLETAALDAEEHARREDFPGAQTSGQRVGSVWLELKYIPDATSGRMYGPYIYGRWRESGRKRSRYLGKPT